MASLRPYRFAAVCAALALGGVGLSVLLLRAGLWSLALIPIVGQGFFGLLLGRYVETIERVSSCDPATGLANRAWFERRLAEERALSERHRSALALLVIDLDRLKAINDTAGHVGGDLAIRRVAFALQRACRRSDTPARWGGDEFVVLAPLTEGRSAMALARRIRAQLARLSPGLTVSIGVAATGPSHWVDPELLFEAADRALLVAKRTGRDRAVLAVTAAPEESVVDEERKERRCA